MRSTYRDATVRLYHLDGDSEGSAMAGSEHAPKRLKSLLGDESEQNG